MVQCKAMANDVSTWMNAIAVTPYMCGQWARLHKRYAFCLANNEIIRSERGKKLLWHTFAGHKIRKTIYFHINSSPIIDFTLEKISHTHLYAYKAGQSATAMRLNWKQFAWFQ